MEEHPATTASEPLDAAPALQLTGRLRCLRCGYDLHGLSVVGSCPECGLKVRATLLAALDPQAEELRPLRFPLVVTIGLIVWSGFGLAASLAIWALHLRGIAAMWAGVHLPAPWGPSMIAGLVAASGVGAAALIAPHAPNGRGRTLAALAAVLAYPALGWAVFSVVRWDMQSPGWAYAEPSVLPLERLALALLGQALIAGIIAGLGPNRRALVARSKVLRSGIIGRQTTKSLLAACAMAAGGYALLIAAAGLTGGGGEALRLSGTFLVAVGSMLLTLGQVGVLADSLRIAPTLLARPLGVKDVLGSETDGGRPAGARP